MALKDENKMLHSILIEYKNIIHKKIYRSFYFRICSSYWNYMRFWPEAVSFAQKAVLNIINIEAILKLNIKWKNYQEHYNKFPSKFAHSASEISVFPLTNP